MYKYITADVHCFRENCYPLAFGVPAILMICSVGKSHDSHLMQIDMSCDMIILIDVYFNTNVQ